MAAFLENPPKTPPNTKDSKTPPKQRPEEEEEESEEEEPKEVDDDEADFDVTDEDEEFEKEEEEDQEPPEEPPEPEWPDLENGPFKRQGSFDVDPYTGPARFPYATVWPVKKRMKIMLGDGLGFRVAYPLDDGLPKVSLFT